MLWYDSYLLYKWLLLFNIDDLRFLDNIKTTTTLRLHSYEHINMYSNFSHYFNRSFIISFTFMNLNFWFQKIIEYIKEKGKSW